MSRDDERRIAALELAIKHNPNADPRSITRAAEEFYRWMRIGMRADYSQLPT